MKSLLLCVGVFVVAATVTGFAGQFETAQTYVKMRDFDRAAETFVAFAEAEPEHEDAPLALYTAARIRALVQDDEEGGQTIFRQLIDGYPDSEWAFYGAMRLAEHSLEQGDSLQAVAHYERTVKIGEKIFPPVSDASEAQFTALQRCGEMYLSLRQYDKAEPCYSRLCDAGLTDRRAMPDVYYKLAACHEGKGNAAEAAELYLDLIRTYPTSREARGLCEAREKIDPYATFEWEPFEYFAEGYAVLRTWPSRAVEHMSNLEGKGASPELVRTGLTLLPWIHYYASDFEKALEAHANYLKRYPDDTSDPYVRYLPMYVDSYREEFEFREFLTSVSLLITEDDTTETWTPEKEYAAISQNKRWTIIDLTPHFGVYNQLLFVDRPLEPTDQAYIRAFAKSDSERTTHIEVDSDDPWVMWLNGAYEGEFTGSPGTARLDLVSGWNEVVIKLTQREGGMTATFRCVDEEKMAEKDLTFSAAKE